MRVSPAGLGDDHLGPVLVEGLPEIRILQGHPDAALLEVSLGPGRHGDRGGPAEGGLHVLRERESSWWLVWSGLGRGGRR